MATQVPSTGEVRFSKLQEIFGGTNPIQFSEYFANASANFTTGVTGIPNTGSEMRVSLFRGKGKNVSRASQTFQYSALPSSYVVGDILEFTYTGSYITFLPQNITSVQVELWGAEGGKGYSSTFAGGKGGYAKGNYTTSPTQSLYVFVGGKGQDRSEVISANWTSGGFNGGGLGGWDGTYFTSGYGGGGGGGASDVRTSTSLNNRIIVAGGGGGGNSGNLGADGGNTNGSSSVQLNSGAGYATGGTQSSGGVSYGSFSIGTNGGFGFGGNGATNANTYGSGGGGGGWYGGGGGGANAQHGSGYGGGGGGGSGYIGGVSSSNMMTGQRTGNGFCRITILSANQGGNGLFNFTSHTFNNAGATGRSGPSLSQVRTTYTNATWAQDTTNNYLNMSISGVQDWTVPATGSYTINAYGARGGGQGGTTYGLGAQIQDTFNLTQGTVIRIAVGQAGADATNASGGGGGTFVIAPPYNTTASILVIAGGGGGSESNPSNSESRAYGDGDANVAGRSGKPPVSATGSGAGGTNGNGGGAASSDNSGGGGGGFFGNGVTNTNWNNGGGSAFANNSQGGSGGFPGGFGGGGGAGGNGGGGGPGGGGGYSGGGGGDNVGGSIAGGGSSYTNGNGTNRILSTGVNNGHGSVTITANFAISTGGSSGWAQSTILNSSRHSSAINTMLPGKTFTLLYRASRDGYTASAFHSRCDGIAGIWVVIKANTGYIATAYSSVAFNSTNNYVAATSGTCWLNNLDNTSSVFSSQWYNTLNPQWSLYDVSVHGPSFGGGNDIYIPNNCNTTTGSTNTPFTYNVGGGGVVDTSQRTLLFGNYNTWTVTDLEVYRIT